MRKKERISSPSKSGKLDPTHSKKLLTLKPEKLSDAQKLELLRYADQLYGDDGQQWMEIGQCVLHVVKASPGLSRDEREEQFDKGFDRLPYQTAMKARRVYEKYQNSPDEVVEYGLDLADRIRTMSKPERVALLKQHGSPRKVRESLPGRSKPAKIAEYRMALGNHDDLGDALQSEAENVVMACSKVTKSFRSELRKSKPLGNGFELALDDDYDLISAEPLVLVVEDGRVVIVLHCTKAEAKARATIIAACMGFEYLQRLIDPDDRLI